MGLNATPALLAAGAAILAYVLLPAAGSGRRDGGAGCGHGLGLALRRRMEFGTRDRHSRRHAVLRPGVGALRPAGAPAPCRSTAPTCCWGWPQAPDGGPRPRSSTSSSRPSILLLASWDRLSRIERGPRAVGPPRGTSALLAHRCRAVVGALPWLASNLRSGFASLRLGDPAAGRVRLLEASSRSSSTTCSPSQLGLRTVPGGAWLGGSDGRAHALVVIARLLVAHALRAAWMARSGSRSCSLAGRRRGGGGLPVPLRATSPPRGTGPTAVTGSTCPRSSCCPRRSGRSRRLTDHSPRDASRRPCPRPRRRSRAAVVAVAGHRARRPASSRRRRIAHESAGVPTHPRAFFSGWSDPNEAARQVVRSMAAHHLRTAYGDYWTAYALDFLAPHTVTVSPSPLDFQRSAAPGPDRRTRHAASLALLRPRTGPLQDAAFANPEPGPGGYTQAAVHRLPARAWQRLPGRAPGHPRRGGPPAPGPRPAPLG